MMSRKKPNPDAAVLAGMRIGVFGKGGAGKSTAVVLLANELQHRGYLVCILDADSTNLGFPLVLGIDGLPEPLMKYYGGTVFAGVCTRS
jgi:CO dehydrogenase nickel-insertion accessory protein CooC1